MIKPCRWPGCILQVPKGQWGCLNHMGKLPIEVQAELHNASTPEQKIAADKAALEWIWSNVD